MAFTNPFSTKTPNVSTITAAEVNLAGQSIQSSVDGTNGGTYTPVSFIGIGGAEGLRVVSGGFLTILSGGTLSVPSGGVVSAASGSTVTLSGATTASDFTMSGTNRIKLGSRSVTRRCRSAPIGAVNFTVNADTYVTQSSTAASEVSWELDAPHGATLTSIEIAIQPAGHSNLPATMPQIRLMRLASNEATGQTIGTVQQDSSGSVGAYTALHSITKTGMSEVIDRSLYNYWVKFEGEAGTDSVTGLIAGTPKYACTMTEMPDH